MNKNLIVAGLATVALAGSAQAVNIEFLGAVSGKSKAVEIKFDGNWQTVNAGALSIKVDGNPAIEAFCVDLEHTITNGNTWSATAHSFANHPADSVNQLMVKNVLASKAGSIANNDQGAALQLAIWDLLYDGGDGLNSGGFKAKNLSGGLQAAYANVFATANAPLTPVSNFNFTYYEADYHGHNGKKYQDLVSLEPVPEPATMAIFGLGALAALRKRKKA